jgi:hypothetical protein
MPDDIIFWTLDGGDAPPADEGTPTDESTGGGSGSGPIDLDGDGLDDLTGEVIFHTMGTIDEGSFDPRSPFGVPIEPNWRTVDLETAFMGELPFFQVFVARSWDDHQPWISLV